MIYVYTLDGFSRQQHFKFQKRKPKNERTAADMFILETQFSHDEEVVTSLCVGGPEGVEDYLFSSSRNGTVCVWLLPEDTKSLDWELVHRISGHTMAINAMCVTENNLITCSDDGCVLVYSMYNHNHNFTQHLERRVALGARCKSMYLHRSANEGAPGFLFVGLNVGRVLICPAGFNI